MGVTNLMKLINKYAPSSVNKKKIKDYKGKIIAIDAILLIYRYSIAIRNKGSDLTRSDNKITSHLHAIFYNARSLLKEGILPVYVFDGKPPKIKKDTIKLRKEKKKKSEQQYEEQQDPQEKIKYFKRTFGITDDMIMSSFELLDYLGLPYIQSPGEADSQSSALAMDKRINVFGVASEDMDHLPFGSPYLLRNFSQKKEIKEINLKKMLNILKLTHEEFIDICILIGTEYCCTIKGLSYTKAYEEYVKIKNMPRFIEHLNNINKKNMEKGKKQLYTIPDNFLDKWRETKQYYLEAQVIDPVELNIKWNPPQRDALLNFMVGENEFNRKNISNHINELKILHNKFSYKKPKKYHKRGKFSGGNCRDYVNNSMTKNNKNVLVY
jgi:flap endonuclease-1